MTFSLPSSSLLPTTSTNTNTKRKSKFPASRGLSRREEMYSKRDLCRLPTRCLMKPPTRFLVETDRFLKPVPFNVWCACLVRLYADNYWAYSRSWQTGSVGCVAREKNVGNASACATENSSEAGRGLSPRLSFISRPERPLLAGKRVRKHFHNHNHKYTEILKKVLFRKCDFAFWWSKK